MEVAQSGSFSKAAKKLFLTQPTISAHIASLEKELDTRVFVRNTKEVDLSPEGQKLYTYARQILADTRRRQSVSRSQPPPFPRSIFSPIS